MTSILDLPEDIFPFILRSLNQKQKMALMLVNKQLYNLTVASLYCSIYLNFGHRAEILIDREICSDFHCGNTILNSNDSFRKLVAQRKELVDNIKSIYIFNSELKLKFWMDSETLLGMREIDLLTHIAIPSFIHVPLENNYTVKELSLDISPVCIDEIDYATIPYLKGLETSKIKNGSGSGGVSHHDIKLSPAIEGKTIIVGVYITQGANL